jgi:hypothetical protein
LEPNLQPDEEGGHLGPLPCVDLGSRHDGLPSLQIIGFHTADEKSSFRMNSE